MFDASDRTEAPVAPAAPGLLDKARYATKTALSLTLAFLVPMAMGWPQPQTAATTVMLIAATGAVSESLHKGVLRVLGTVIGAVVGLTLVALFPQDRMTYLLAASLAAAFFVYLYNAYQGDGTLFMLSAVVTLMVFNSGDADGAFLYGVDRTFMTIVGVIAYTLVASLIWPVRTAVQTEQLASTVSASFARLFAVARDPQTAEEERDAALTAVFEARQAFDQHFMRAARDADSVRNYAPEWQTVRWCYQQLDLLSLPVVERGEHFQAGRQSGLVAEADALFAAIDARWEGDDSPAIPAPATVQLDDDTDLDDHLELAAKTASVSALARMVAVLRILVTSVGTICCGAPAPKEYREPRKQPSFVWMQPEAIKTAARAFISFWLACAVWIYFNPPGGFTFVAMCTIFVPLISFTPVTPKLLMILLSIGFFFAIPAYVFLLPTMTHWLELCAFIFLYAFLGFFVLPGPITIFYLLGLFTLGISNQMSYHFDVILTIMLMFYMIAAMLIIIVHVPFSSKPERLFELCRRRFLRQSAAIILRLRRDGPWTRQVLRWRLGAASLALVGMKQWLAQMPALKAQHKPQLLALTRSCERTYGELRILVALHADTHRIPLLQRVLHGQRDVPLSDLGRALAERDDAAIDALSAAVEQRQDNVSAEMEQRLPPDWRETLDRDQLALFYTWLNLSQSVFDNLSSAAHHMRQVNWGALHAPRF